MPPPTWDPPSQPPKKKAPPVLLILGIIAIPCFCCPVLSAILFPVFAEARLAARHTENMNRMRRISSDVLTFAQDHQGHLPPMGSYDQFEAALQPYETRPTIGKDPLRDVQGQAFYLNPRLSSRTLSAFKAPSVVPLLREPPLRRQTRIAIAYLDGHVENYPSAAEAARVWQNGLTSPE